MKICLADNLFKPKNKDYLGFPGINPDIQIVDPAHADYAWYCCEGDSDDLRSDLRFLDGGRLPLISVTLSDWGYEECLSPENRLRHFAPALLDWTRCVPYRYTPEIHLDTKKDLLASFVGTFNSHSLRRRLLDFKSDDVLVEERDWWGASDQQRTEYRAHYNDVMNRSRFCFCPRGYGHSSMRMTDAILRGAIPLTVEDDSWWFGQNLGSFAIRGSFDNLKDILAVARKMSDEEYRERRKVMAQFRDKFLLRDLYCGCVGTLGWTGYIREVVHP